MWTKLKIISLFIFTVAVVLSTFVDAQTQVTPATATHPVTAGCEEPAYHTLDFWVGEWEVFDSQDGSKAGQSDLKKVLQGCAIQVDWVGSEGEHIKELFYYYKPKQQWIQVWVGDNGGAKQRQFVERSKDGSVRFQGEVALTAGGSYLDRSTVTPVRNGRVHQVIEISRDGGKTWQRRFDAEYRKKGQKESDVVEPSGEKSVHYDSD